MGREPGKAAAAAITKMPATWAGIANVLAIMRARIYSG
ncbi:hypothetical protein HMPREF1502_4302 [Klebsiella sp. AS10]|nr:hypothetical protein HMPREF1502_4302 [Klebsiella sp. AS10]